MDGRKLLGLLGLSGGALVLAILSACATPPPEDTQGSSSSVTARAFDRNAVIDDISMRDSAATTAADLQTFLEKTPWGTASALAKYTENGKTAAEIMVDAATTYGINPIEMVVRVQMEQGLVSKTTATAATLAKAFGCGCADGAACTAKYSGFSAQADCAAGTMSRSMTKALTTTGTVSGWSRGKSKASLDGLTIVPKNAATAALYTYTPWVGEAGGGKAGVGGVSLHAQVWDRFATAMSYGAWAAPATGNANATQSATHPDAGPTDPATPDPTTDPTTDPSTDPPADPSTDPPTDPSTDPSTDSDAGAPADPGATGDGTTPDTDAGADAGAGKKKPSTKGPPADGSDDGAILGEGSAPPSSNAPPPIGSNDIPTHPEELPEASEADLAGKTKSSSGGCSTTGHDSGSSNGLLIAGAAALAIASARRRRR
jgi:MYXO-CTERM domain-containing protein